MTWNLHQAVDRRQANVEATRRYIEETIRPTVALLQESVVTSGPSDRRIASKADPLPYETAVVAYAGRLLAVADVTTRYSTKVAFRISPHVPGSFAVAQVLDVPGVDPLVAISAYGRMAPLYAQTAVLRMVADLIPLFDTPGLSDRIVLGGDLNAYDQTTDKVMRARWLAIIAAIESLGLVNLLKRTQTDRPRLDGCPCGDIACWHVETFRHRNRPADVPGYFTTDYLFATESLASHLSSLEIWGDRPGIWGLSDHCPLVARFDL
jgi:hypothetical protein